MDKPPSVSDCLSQDCEDEKRHSNRRQFLEQYYNSRTQLSPSTKTSSSSFNISTPLNRLSECDAITRRLLSTTTASRNSKLVESPVKRLHISELDRSRRASLGTNSMTDQLTSLFSSSTSSGTTATTSRLKSNYNKGNKTHDDNISRDNQNEEDEEEGEGESDLRSGGNRNISGDDIKLKHHQQQQQQQQQQGRSLSVCDEETLNPRLRSASSNHSSNLNRAISLACESGSSSLATKRLSTLIPLFGCDIRSLEQFTKIGLILPPVINSAIDHILINGINSIGIFRKSGVRSRILTLRQRIETNQELRFNELNKNNEFSIYDIADLVKMWFRELKPVPLMTKELIKLISNYLNTTTTHNKANTTKAHQTITKSSSSSQQQHESSSSRIISSLGRTIETSSIDEQIIETTLLTKIDSITTQTHRALLYKALNFLAQISARCDINQMTSQNLAICLTPSLCATESDQNCILNDQRALEYCIDNHQVLFER